MFGTLGGPEILLILVLALIVFGPRKLPEIGKSLGRVMAEFRKASNEFRRTIEDEVEAERPRPPEPPPELPPPAADFPLGEPRGEPEGGGRTEPAVGDTSPTPPASATMGGEAPTPIEPK